jgi:hypothetical protein
MIRSFQFLNHQLKIHQVDFGKANTLQHTHLKLELLFESGGHNKLGIKIATLNNKLYVY